MEWIGLAQKTYRWQALFNVNLLASQEGLCSMEWVNIYVYAYTHKYIIYKFIYIQRQKLKYHKVLFLSFRRFLNVNYSFLGNSPASEF